MVNLTRVLAIEWASRNINVNAIGPTFVRTPLTEKLFQEESFKREVLSRIPLGRLGKPEDVAGAVVFLLQSGSGPDHGAYVAGGRRLDGDLIEAGFAGLLLCRHGGYRQPNRG